MPSEANLDGIFLLGEEGESHRENFCGRYCALAR